MEVILEQLKDINKNISDWQNLSENDKLNTIRTLKSITTIEKLPVPKDPELTCPEFHYPLAIPCNLSSCAFHISSPKNFNCIYHGLDNAKKKRMTANDVSSCTGLSISEINGHINNSITKIRMVRMKEDIMSTRINKFEYNKGHCITCGQYIADELDLGTNPNLIIEFGKFGYCSDQCKKAKAPWKFKLEHNYLTDWEYVIISAIDYLSIIKTTNKEIELLLGVDPFNLNKADKEAVNRYKGIML